MRPDHTTAVIIVAGGSGTRIGGPVPKQFIRIGEIPVIVHTIERFRAVVPDQLITVVIPEGDIGIWNGISDEFGLAGIRVCYGGRTRYHSVLNALEGIPQTELIAVHDAVRPVVSPELIRRLIGYAAKHGNAVPAVMTKDSYRQITEQGSRIVDRGLLRAVQTPQVFRREQLLEGYSLPFVEKFTDDASVVESAGYYINLTEGEYRNIKITTPEDIGMAGLML